MYVVVHKLIEVLSQTPDPVFSAGSLGTKIPWVSSDLPAIVISLVVDDETGNGIGRFIRSGNALASTSTVEAVEASNERFLDNFRRLRLHPLPLRKRPSSTEPQFTEDDVQIVNVTDQNNPVSYQVVEQPAALHEFALDATRAEVRFGQAQQLGDQLSVSHWTVTWRDEIRALRYNGTLTLEVWAGSFEAADTIARRLQDRLRTQPSLLREKGFARLRPASLAPAQNSQHDPLGNAAFSAWRQKLGYVFTFEAEEGGELSSGGIIERIDVDMNDALPESFRVPHNNEQ